MELKFIDINGEKLLPVVLYGQNRDMEITLWHSRIMEGYFKLNMNYISCPFPGVSHGSCVNQVISSTIDTIKPDYYFFCDNDSIFLTNKTLNIMYNSVKYKNGIWAQATQSNHKKGPNGQIPHAYASQAALCFSTQIYNTLGRPDLDHWSEQSDEFGGDTCERLTYEAKRKGYQISLIYPSYSIEPNTNLDNGCKFGRGNFYGPNLMYHQMQNNHPNSTNEFINVCKRVLNNEFE